MSASAEVFYNLALAPFGRTVTGQGEVVASDFELSDLVARDPLAIGYTGFAGVRNASAVAIEGSCGIRSMPTEYSIKSEDYPYTRRLYAYTSPAALEDEQVTDMMDFLDTDEAQRAITNSGFVSLSMQTAAITEQGMRVTAMAVDPDIETSLGQIREVLNQMIGQQRLSTTIRFEADGSTIDARSRGEILRLVRLISDGAYDGKTLTIAGFTDASGPGGANGAVSALRANIVLNRILGELAPDARAKVSFNVAGFGELSPIVCSSSPRAGFVNRRV